LEKNWPINEKIIEKRTGKNLKEYLKYLINFIDKNVSERNILFGLGEILSEKQKNWVKTNLKKEVLFLLKVYLRSI